MGGNSSYDPKVGCVPLQVRTHKELSERIDGHKILIQKGNSSRTKIPVNSNSESPTYLCAHDYKDKDGNKYLEITSIGIYEKHEAKFQIDLEFDKNGDAIAYSSSVRKGEKTSHLHKINKDSETGMIGRKSYDKNNHHPIPKEYNSLIKKIVAFNKSKRNANK